MFAASARAAGPINDNFSSATKISGSSGTTTGSNVGATKETGEPNHGGNVGGASIWYSWTAPSTGSATITTEGSDFDTELGVYTGSSVDSLTTIAENDDVSASDLTSAVTFNATSGTTYKIAVDGFNGPVSGQHTGDVTLNWSVGGGGGGGGGGPANDMFANSQTISGTSGSTTGSNVGATNESGEPDIIAGDSGGASVWYSWTAPVSGDTTITTEGSNFDTILSASSPARASPR
jgi:hypothetical protein